MREGTLAGAMQGAGLDAAEDYRRRQRKAFDAARRHSRLVTVLRAAIPAACVVSIAGIALFTVFDPFAPLDRTVAVSTEGVTGSQITMQLPKLSGFKRDLRSYDVTAASAVQEVRRPTEMQLSRPEARIEIEKDRYARIVAEQGLYDSATEKMRLAGNVQLRSDQGYEVELSDADVNLKAGSIASGNPVRVKLTNGVITADSILAEDSGKVIRFDGHVTSLFNGVETAPAARPDQATPESGAEQE